MMAYNSIRMQREQVDKEELDNRLVQWPFTFLDNRPVSDNIGEYFTGDYGIVLSLCWAKKYPYLALAIPKTTTYEVHYKDTTYYQRNHNTFVWEWHDGYNTLGYIEPEEVANRLSCPIQYIEGLQRCFDLWYDVLHEHIRRVQLACDDLSVRAEQIVEETEEYRQKIKDDYRYGRPAKLAQWREDSDYKNIPTSLSFLRGRIQRGHLNRELPCHVYFLVNKDEVVYVGKTTQYPPEMRVFGHKEKEWDSYYLLPIDMLALDKAETDLIQRLKPKYNIQHK